MNTPTCAHCGESPPHAARVCPACQGPDETLRLLMETRAKLARQIAIGHSNSLDWARDHTHLQKLCRERGFSEFEVEGDSFGVPGITDLADMLASAPAPAYRPTLTNET